MGKSLPRERKRLIRQKILFLTGGNGSRMKNPEIVKEIQRLSKQLESDLIADERPLPSLDPDKSTKEKYQHFLDLGHQIGDIRKALGLGTITFQNW